jgi:hypothetical protein
MTQSADHNSPPHLELLGAPEVRPFENALAEVKKRWTTEVAQYTERTVFTDQRWSIDDDAARD